MKKFSCVLASVLAAGVLGGCATCDWGKDRKTEEVITMDQLPAVVKPLAEKELAGAVPTKIEKEQKKGKTVYEICYKDKDGEEMELKYAEDGTLLRKQRD